MNDEQLTHQILDVCLNIKPEEHVWINSWDHTLDLTSKIAKELLRRECPLLYTVQPEELWLDSILTTPIEQLEQLSEFQKTALETTDAYIYTLGPKSPVPWEKIPDERQKAVTLWFLEENRFVEEWKSISRRRKIRMLAIEATLATPERAKALDLNYEEWRDVMYEGCMADYRAIARQAKGLMLLLSKSGEIRITTPRGTDLSIKLDRRPVFIDNGIATEEKAEEGKVTYIPSGCLELTVDEASAEGRVVYDAPTRTTRGVIEGLQLTFEHGRVKEFSAQKHAEIFQEYLKGEGDVDWFAFLGFGLNPKLRHGFTQDDKVYGGVTLGLGDNRDKGGKNRTKSGRGWWSSIRGATVTLGGEEIVTAGRLQTEISDEQ